MKIYYQTRNATTVPMLHVANHFLYQFGFHVGDAVDVIYEQGRLTIVKIEGDKQEKNSYD